MGLAAGYRLPLGKGGRWCVEFSLGVGYAYLDYDRFFNIPNGAYVDTRHRNFFGIDHVGISLVGEVNIKPEYNSSLPFLPSYVNSISLEDTFHYVGKKVVWCSDNKFRECKAVKLNFEYEGHPYSELFFVDKSVEEDYAILGSTFWSKCDILK